MGHSARFFSSHRSVSVTAQSLTNKARSLTRMHHESNFHTAEPFIDEDQLNLLKSYVQYNKNGLSAIIHGKNDGSGLLDWCQSYEVPLEEYRDFTGKRENIFSQVDQMQKLIGVIQRHKDEIDPSAYATFKNYYSPCLSWPKDDDGMREVNIALDQALALYKLPTHQPQISAVNSR